jgi:aspartyl/asparaginyl beta-hydroxylase (cupin superfamily)
MAVSGFIDYRTYPDLVALVDELRSHWTTIRQEARAELGAFFKSPETAIQNADDIRQFVLPLKWQGQTVNAGHGLPYGEEKLEFFPVTAAAIAHPLVVSALFSLSVPGLEIWPHIDNEAWIGDVWRLHLGLDCPDGCGLMVDGQVREWRDGEVLCFDSARVLHSAWNRGAAPRLILIVDVNRRLLV